MQLARWRPSASLLRTAFAAAAVTWAVLLIAAPLLASRAHASQAASLLILGVYGIGSLVCHQLPERSYHFWTVQMPVCARCTGIYLGAVLAVVGARGFQPRVGLRSSARLALRNPRLLLAVAIAPTMATLVSEWTTGVMPSHAIRAAAGASIGVAVAWLVVAVADNQVN